MHKRKWCVTTVTVLVYLLANIIGRLSVAAFGLTFDLNEEQRIEYPTSITNWNTKDWVGDSMLSSDHGLSDSDIGFYFLNENLRKSERSTRLYR